MPNALQRILTGLAYAFDSTAWSYDRKNPRFHPGRGVGHEDDLVSSYERDTQRINARDLMRNYPVGRGIVRCISSAVIGSGIKPSSQSSDRAYSKKLESAWAVWCYRPEVTKTKSMKVVQSLCVAHRVSDGGVAIKLLSGGDIELIEVERFRAPEGQDVPYEIAGDGSVKYWWIADRKAGGGFEEPKRFRATDIITFFDFERIDQLMPYSQLAACSKNLRDLAETMDNAHKQVKDQSVIALNYKRGQSGSGLPLGRGKTSEDKDAALNSLAKASGYSLIDGDGELKMVQPVAPGTQLEPFLRFSLQLISMSVELPYSFVLKYFDSSYSASRSTLLQARAKIVEWQNDFCSEIMEQLWIWKITSLIADGVLDAPPVDDFLTVKWQPPAFEWIDQNDAIQSEILEIKTGLRLAGDGAMKRGYQLDDLYRARASEIKLRNEIAAEFGIDPAQLSDIVVPGAANGSTAEAYAWDDVP